MKADKIVTVTGEITEVEYNVVLRQWYNERIFKEGLTPVFGELTLENKKTLRNTLSFQLYHLNVNLRKFIKLILNLLK